MITKAHGLVSSCIGQTNQFGDGPNAPIQHSLKVIGPTEGTRFSEYKPFSLTGHESTAPVSQTTTPVVAVGQPTSASFNGLFRYKKADIFSITFTFKSSELSSLLDSNGDGSDGDSILLTNSG